MTREEARQKGLRKQLGGGAPTDRVAPPLEPSGVRYSVLLVGLLLFFILPQTVGAQQFREIQPRLQIPVPNLQFSQIATPDPGGLITINYLPEYIAAVYSYLVGIAGLIAIAMIMYGGAKWVFSAGDAEKIGVAKEVITHALIGLMLSVGSYVILYTINPRLVRFDALSILNIERVLLEVDESQAAIGETGVGTADVPYFGQFDRAWAEKKPGDPEWPFHGDTSECTTILKRGCGTTSLAMVLNYRGFSTDPLQTARWGLGCTGGWQPRYTLDALSEQWPGAKSQLFYKNQVDRVFELLRAGNPIIYNCAPCTGYLENGSLQPTPYNGHYVVLTGFDEQGRILVNDPGRSAARRTAYFTPEQIKNEFKIAVYIYR